MFKILSYPIKDGDPTWPGNPTCSLEPHTSIAKGDTANTATIHLFNHYGTHLDGPMHFNPNGISLDKVPVERFFYQKPLVIDVPKKAGEKILIEDLMPYKDQIAQADFLFLRTVSGGNAKAILLFMKITDRPLEALQQPIYVKISQI